MLFSIVAIPIYNPTTVHKCSLFSTSSPTFVISCLFDDNNSYRCELIYLIVVLICISLTINDVAHLFMYLLTMCMSSLENVSSDLLPIFKTGLLVCFCFWVVWVLYIFWILAPYQIYDLQIFLSCLDYIFLKYYTISPNCFILWLLGLSIHIFSLSHLPSRNNISLHLQWKTFKHYVPTSLLTFLVLLTLYILLPCSL